MMYLLYIGVTIATFLFMEGVTWFTHKFVMHGFLWYLHKDHHIPENNGVFEKNDSFFIIFAIPSILLIYFGINPSLNVLFFIGLGIFFYGMAYFLVHDVFIHQRFSWMKNVKHPYLQWLRRAHHMHHVKKSKGECFGMLLVPGKYKNTNEEQ